MHNRFRSRLARGLEYDRLMRGNAWPAAKMLKMVYDCEIEMSAMRNAAGCIYRHTYDYERPELGESIYEYTARYFNKTAAAAMASKWWWNELKQNGVGPANIITDELWNRPEMIGHYTQMAWETTYKLGCAVAHCPQTYVVCQYYPAYVYQYFQIGFV
ncbi:SCP-like protein [Oesophagostomum dentatum]|uniref:SCP-like protein n=1 Tax=Oesophagostomum dentatum TaxID=61180 RepID=A0A0B1SQK1_OESDE|nr:SCP-like protein [Oesophagostomum dentatum]